MPEKGSGIPTASKKKAAGFRSRRQSGPTIRKPRQHDPYQPAQQAASVSGNSAPPLPKRNKGRFFIGSIFLSVFGIIAYVIWTMFLQYHAFGVIQGRLITVSSPWDGVVVNWRVKEGQFIDQGQPIAEITNLRMRHELEKLLDDLKLNQAQLEAETARLNFISHNNQTEAEKALAEFLQASGELDAEKARLDDLNRQLERARKLKTGGNFSQQKYDKLYFETVGQKRKVNKLAQAVQALKSRHHFANSESSVDLKPQLQPMLAKIETIKAEVKRIREKIQQGIVEAPVSGRITQRLLLTGEAIEMSEPIVEILENNSTEAILYVSQANSDRFEVGRAVSVEIPPIQSPVTCEIVRIGNQLEIPPSHIAKYYSEDAVLLPVYLKPFPEYEQLFSFRINGMIKLPVEYDSKFTNLVSDLIKRANALLFTESRQPSSVEAVGEIHLRARKVAHSNEIAIEEYGGSHE